MKQILKKDLPFAKKGEDVEVEQCVGFQRYYIRVKGIDEKLFGSFRGVFIGNSDMNMTEWIEEVEDVEEESLVDKSESLGEILRTLEERIKVLENKEETHTTIDSSPEVEDKEVNIFPKKPLKPLKEEFNITYSEYKKRGYQGKFFGHEIRDLHISDLYFIIAYLDNYIKVLTKWIEEVEEKPRNESGKALEVVERVPPFDVHSIMCGSSTINLGGKEIRIINSTNDLSNINPSDIVIATHRVMRKGKSCEIVSSLVKKGGKLIVH